MFGYSENATKISTHPSASTRKNSCTLMTTYHFSVLSGRDSPWHIGLSSTMQLSNFFSLAVFDYYFPFHCLLNLLYVIRFLNKDQLTLFSCESAAIVSSSQYVKLRIWKRCREKEIWVLAIGVSPHDFVVLILFFSREEDAPFFLPSFALKVNSLGTTHHYMFREQVLRLITLS